MFKVSQAELEPNDPDSRTWKPMSAQGKKCSELFALPVATVVDRNWVCLRYDWQMPVVTDMGQDFSKRPNADETLPCNVCYLRFPTGGYTDSQMRRRGHCLLCVYMKFEEENMDEPHKRKYGHDKPEEDFCRNCPDTQLSLPESWTGYCTPYQNARRAPRSQMGLSFPQRTIIKNEQKAYEAKLPAAAREALKPKPGSRHEALYKIDQEQQAFMFFQDTDAYSLTPDLHGLMHNQKIATPVVTLKILPWCENASLADKDRAYRELINHSSFIAVFCDVCYVKEAREKARRGLHFGCHWRSSE